MTDTLELLESIGRDASLRHASAEVLGRVLDEAKASDGLRAAVASGDGSKLDVDFRDEKNYMGHQQPPPQSTQYPGGDEEKTDDDEDSPDSTEKTPGDGTSSG
ncbi:hypothetical protein [Luteibacter sp. CQ10]|uniref:hypothetical protein n=1 Tax=Luteibacter sp. CQ10 TaxID=2805821 RepID=UPI0034A5B147